MNTKERAPGSAATLTGAAGGKSGETFSILNFTTGETGRQPRFVERLLSHGAENGLTLRDLIALTSWSERQIRAEIQQERLAGIPILADNQSGYFLPATEDEREQFIKSMRHRAGEILKSAAAIEQGGMID